MRKEDAPQDEGILGEWRKLHYVVGDGERYETVPTTGFEPANIANALAWDLVRKRIEEARASVERGEASPLAWHAARRQMDAALLAQYAGLSRRKVKRHLTPRGFARMNDAERECYAEVFEVSPEELDRVSSIK